MFSEVLLLYKSAEVIVLFDEYSIYFRSAFQVEAVSFTSIEDI